MCAEIYLLLFGWEVSSDDLEEKRLDKGKKGERSEGEGGERESRESPG